MQHRPEYQLSSQSPVLTAKFHPFDTHVIIGGTYSGQVADDRHADISVMFQSSPRPVESNGCSPRSCRSSTRCEPILISDKACDPHVQLL